MHSTPIPADTARRVVPWLFGLVFVASVVACQPETTIRKETVVQLETVVREQTVVQTVEVTRLVEVPVTVTPSPTPEISPTPTGTPTATFTPEPTATRTLTPTYQVPRVEVQVLSSCLFGPGVGYLFHYDINPTAIMDVLGWMETLEQKKDGTWEPTMWVYVRAPGGKNSCWIHGSLVKPSRGEITDAPMYTNRLPHSELYQPPKAVSARRDGDVVTIIWSYVWMTEDDYRGYLVEAWVCHQGQMYFAPVSWRDANVSHLALAIPDEPGCSQPSSGRLYTVEKHGYTDWILIPWPQANP
jgi:hypothetical protein